LAPALQNITDLIVHVLQLDGMFVNVSHFHPSLIFQGQLVEDSFENIGESSVVIVAFIK
jgi:hypothetical protein